MLVNFLGSLFHDIFLEGRLGEILDVMEEVIVESRKRLEMVQKKRERLRKMVEKTEKLRTRLFNRLGGEKRGRVNYN